MPTPRSAARAARRRDKALLAAAIGRAGVTPDRPPDPDGPHDASVTATIHAFASATPSALLLVQADDLAARDRRGEPPGDRPRATELASQASRRHGRSLVDGDRCADARRMRETPATRGAVGLTPSQSIADHCRSHSARGIHGEELDVEFRANRVRDRGRVRRHGGRGPEPAQRHLLRAGRVVQSRRRRVREGNRHQDDDDAQGLGRVDRADSPPRRPIRSSTSGSAAPATRTCRPPSRA